MQNNMILYAVLLVLVWVTMGSCRKKHNSLANIDYRNTLVFALDKEYIDKGNLWTSDNYLCNQSVDYPLIVNGQPNYSLCRITYLFDYMDIWIANYDIRFSYSVIDSSSNIYVDSPYVQQNAHRSIELVNTFFSPRSIAFALHPDSTGIYLRFKSRSNDREYSTVPPLNVAVNPNNDGRFYFRFTEAARIEAYDEPDNHAPPLVTYAISARGQFATMLYASTGDSLMITNGEFRLPFCE